MLGKLLIVAINHSSNYKTENKHSAAPLLSYFLAALLLICVTALCVKCKVLTLRVILTLSIISKRFRSFIPSITRSLCLASALCVRKRSHLAGNLRENGASVPWSDMPTALLTNSGFSNYCPARRRQSIFTCMCIPGCISVALFAC